jgi:hypothetical protein
MSEVEGQPGIKEAGDPVESDPASVGDIPELTEVFPGTENPDWAGEKEGASANEE